jgi:VIT1/CCC1 family predicted Fe2+/Mn2+ transporter
MKAVIEFSWKILVAIIAAVIAFILILLIVVGILKPGNLSNSAAEMCILLVSKLQILGIGAQNLGICDTFLRA